MSEDKYDENPEPFIEDTEQGTIEALPEEEKPIPMVEEEDDEEEMPSDEIDESIDGAV